MIISAKNFGLSIISITISAVIIIFMVALITIHKANDYLDVHKVLNEISVDINLINTSLATLDNTTRQYHARFFVGADTLIQKNIITSQQHNLKELSTLLVHLLGNIQKLKQKYQGEGESNYFVNLKSQINIQLGNIFDQIGQISIKMHNDQTLQIKRDLIILSGFGLLISFLILASAFIYYKGFLQPVILASKLYRKHISLSSVSDFPIKVVELIRLFNSIKRSRNKLVYNAAHDELTKLYNRAQFKTELQNCVKNKPYSHNAAILIYFDLDNFKMVNDSLGHFAGDLLLIEIANRLRKIVSSDSCLARVGGDEFAILFQSVNPDELQKTAIHHANDILNTLTLPMWIKQRKIHVSASLGITYIPEHGDNVDICMKHADIALYSAKGKGKSTYEIYHRQLSIDADNQLKLESEIDYAIETDQFFLHYQPQIDSRTGRICGLEALVRWQHPTKGLIPPIQFIKVAERTDIIQRLGYWVVKTVFSDMQEWARNNINLPLISINISTHQFKQFDLCGQIQKLSDTYKIDKQKVCFEITETAFVDKSVNVIDCISSLSQLGFQFAIDDFGKGYSCLSYINRLPVNVIKIDKEFIDTIDNEQLNTSALNAIIALSNGLSVKLVAEGVENIKQLDYLTHKNCFIIQGYLFSRPQLLSDIDFSDNYLDKL